MARQLITVLCISLLACGGSPPPTQTAADVEAEPEVAAGPSLDWALLLPIDTSLVVRADLARLRASAHSEWLDPFVEAFIEGVDEAEGDDALDEAMMRELFERTDEVLFAVLPPRAVPSGGGGAQAGADAFMLFARGRYRADEVDALLRASAEGGPEAALEPRRFEADGFVITMPADDDNFAITQLAPDMLLATNSRAELALALARTRMSDATRWPTAVRDLAEALRIEDASLAIAGAPSEPGQGDDGMRFAARIDLDDDLAAEARIDLGGVEEASVPLQMIAALLQGMMMEALSELGGPERLSQAASEVVVRVEDGVIVATLALPRARATEVLREIQGLIQAADAAEASEPPNGPP